MTTPESVYSALKELPPPLLDQVMDYVEFLHYKNQAKTADAVDLLAFKGALENSRTFSGDAVALQNELRADWR